MLGYYWNLGKVLTISTTSTTCAHISKNKILKKGFNVNDKFTLPKIPTLSLYYIYIYICVPLYTSQYFFILFHL